MFATHASIIEKIGVAALAEALGVDQSHVRTMKARSSIPSRYWVMTVEAAAAKGIEGVTHEELARIVALPLSSERSEPKQGEAA